MPIYTTMLLKRSYFNYKGDPEPTFPDDGKLPLFSMRFCPYAQRAHLVLEAKQIPYHTYNINLVNKPEWFFKYSPSGQTPALGLTNEQGNPFIGESLIVADYLDEKYPERKLYPEDPLAKANDRLLLERFNKVIIASYVAAGIMSGTGALKTITDGLDEFEAELKKRNTKFFGGDQPGMLDYMIWPWFERIDSLKYNADDRFELDNERYAKLVRMKERSSKDWQFN